MSEDPDPDSLASRAWRCHRTVIVYGAVSRAIWARDLGVLVALNPEAAIEINDKCWATGVTMDRCWIGKGRIITQSYSIWDDGSGRCVGTRYNVISEPDQILHFCAKARIDVPDWITAQEA